MAGWVDCRVGRASKHKDSYPGSPAADLPLRLPRPNTPMTDTSSAHLHHHIIYKTMQNVNKLDFLE